MSSIKPKKKTCIRCGEKCSLYARLHKSPNKLNGRPSNAIKKQSKKGAKVSKMDTEFFKEIWNERLHTCEITNQYLGDHYQADFFSHIITKAARPDLRHVKENIMLMHPDVHREWESGPREKFVGQKMDPEFKAKFFSALKRYGDLIIKYAR